MVAPHFEKTAAKDQKTGTTKIMFCKMILSVAILLGQGLAALGFQAQAQETAHREPANIAATGKAASTNTPHLHPGPPEPISDTAIVAALDRGVEFLLHDQRPDGSWGSPERTKNLNIIAGIGSHHAFRVATTALCVSALIELDRDAQVEIAHGKAVHRAVELGEEFLFRELPLVRRDEPMLIYNVWAHGYGIMALVRMHGRLPDDKPRRAGSGP